MAEIEVFGIIPVSMWYILLVEEVDIVSPNGARKGVKDSERMGDCAGWVIENGVAGESRLGIGGRGSDAVSEYDGDTIVDGGSDSEVENVEVMADEGSDTEVEAAA